MESSVGIGAACVLVALVGLAAVAPQSAARSSSRHSRPLRSSGCRTCCVPDGMGGHIQVEHLLLTGQGFVVIDAKSFAGTIFASERMAEWTVIGKQGRFTFPNPLGTLYDRVAALRQLVRDVPVAGHVLFAGGADFTKGRPRDVLSAAELVERYRRPDQADLERLLVAFAPHWDRVKAAIEPVP